MHHGRESLFTPNLPKLDEKGIIPFKIVGIIEGSDGDMHIGSNIVKKGDLIEMTMCKRELETG
jgi:hypothetical protein